MITLITEYAALLCIAAYAALRLKYELQMMQQNSYRPARYLRWLKGNITDTARITDAMLLAVLLLFRDNIWAVGGAGAVTILKSAKEISRRYKKPLVFTQRAIRIYTVQMLALLLPAAAAVSFASASAAVSYAMCAAVAAPLVVLLAVWILWPVEKLINRYYYNDAARILKGMPDLIVIGITGSYGKTSTKHFLHRILSEKYNVLMTPGSFNTTLGVIRTVREQLKPYHEVFIVEMGAKQRGDVKEICELVHPRIGIITAVGKQHLESFGCVENVQAAKFELADALPADGTVILNDDFGMIASRPVNNTGSVLRYGVQAQAGFRATDISYEGAMSTFAITEPDGTATRMETRLMGECNISNIMAAYIAARTLSMEPRDIAYAVSQLSPVEHRLSVRHTSGGVTIIDDAFNSNPHGSKMALDVLASFTGGRRIIVTPGMIELGARQREENMLLGRYMCTRCDTAILVGRYNREALHEGLSQAGFPEQDIIETDTFAEATARLREIMRSGDTVLYENDLPDTFK